MNKLEQWLYEGSGVVQEGIRDARIVVDFEKLGETADKASWGVHSGYVDGDYTVVTLKHRDRGIEGDVSIDFSEDDHPLFIKLRGTPCEISLGYDWKTLYIDGGDDVEHAQAFGWLVSFLKKLRVPYKIEKITSNFTSNMKSIYGKDAAKYM